MGFFQRRVKSLSPSKAVDPASPVKSPSLPASLPRSDGRYSDADIERVLEALNPEDLLRWIGYRVESVQKHNARTIKCLCPIHREEVFRTLFIDGARKVFRCAHGPCPGSAGGTLIQLYAAARGMGFEAALEDMAARVGVVLGSPKGGASGADGGAA